MSVPLRSASLLPARENKTYCFSSEAQSHRFKLEICSGCCCCWRRTGDCTNLRVSSSPVNPMDDIDVDVCKSFSKSEKLKRGRTERKREHLNEFPQRPKTAKQAMLLTNVSELILNVKSCLLFKSFWIFSRVFALATCCKDERLTPTL